MEISKPRIVVLLVITAVTSMYAANKLVPDAPQLDYLAYLHIIIAGALASAGSSALNHYYDKDIDPKMTRTSTRPIPSGRMKSSHVLIYGLIVSCISVIYGYFALNAVSAFFIALGIFSYVIIYTVWLKRLNTSNIVIGGIAGSAAAWAGWSAATGSMDLLGFLVGFLVFVWTPSHFWCLAMKIKDEYAQAKIPMLPVVIGMQRTSKYILGNTLILLPYSLMLSAFGMGIVYAVIAAMADFRFSFPVRCINSFSLGRNTFTCGRISAIFSSQVSSGSHCISKEVVRPISLAFLKSFPRPFRMPGCRK